MSFLMFYFFAAARPPSRVVKQLEMLFWPRTHADCDQEDVINDSGTLFLQHAAMLALQALY